MIHESCTVLEIALSGNAAHHVYDPRALTSMQHNRSCFGCTSPTRCNTGTATQSQVPQDGALPAWSLYADPLVHDVHATSCAMCKCLTNVQRPAGPCCTQRARLLCSSPQVSQQHLTAQSRQRQNESEQSQTRKNTVQTLVAVEDVIIGQARQRISM